MADCVVFQTAETTLRIHSAQVTSTGLLLIPKHTVLRPKISFIFKRSAIIVLPLGFVFEITALPDKITQENQARH